MKKNTVYKKGYLGIGNHKSCINGNKNPIYIRWKDMLRRCYDDKSHIRNPAYKECSVSEEWHNYQNFAKWWEQNYDNENMQDWQLDKDILIKDNKIYGPNTCCIIPKEINRMFAKSKGRRGDLPIGVCIGGRKKHRFLCKIHADGKSLLHKEYSTIEEAFSKYKELKENHIKEVAERYKRTISENVYNALINYKIEITD